MHFNVAGKIVKLMKSHMSNDKLVLKSIGIQLHYNMYMQINMSEGLDFFLSIYLLDVTLSLYVCIHVNFISNIMLKKELNLIFPITEIRPKVR